MVRSRALAHLLPLFALLGLGVPLAAAAPISAAAARQAELAAPAHAQLAVPRAMLHSSAAVPVIVEMGDTSAARLAQWSPQLPGLLARVRLHLLDVLRADHASGVYSYHLIPAIAATVPGAAISSLLTQPGVRAVVLDQWHPLLPNPMTSNLSAVTDAAPSGADSAVTGTTPGGLGPQINVTQTKEPESFSLTRADVAQQHGYDGAGVRVAIVDSGIDLSQPDLAGTMALDANGQPLRVDFTGTDLRDTVGHGTACASMIAAQGRVLYEGDNKTLQQVYPQPGPKPTIYRSHFHVYGMAPRVQLMSAKIFDSRAPHGGGYDSWIVRAIEWAVDNHADVISESFGGLSIPSNGTDPTALADEMAIHAGITVVAADGNEGPGQSTISSPANAPDVIAVGASTQFRQFGQTGFLAPFGRTTNDNIASFTSRGPTTDGRPRPDLVAPGAFSWALFPTTKSDDGPTTPPYDVGTFGGTSQATPVTAGAAALVIGAFRKSHGGITPSPALVRSILMSSAHDLGYPASDQGAGRLDAWQAVQTAVHSGPSFLLGPNSIAGSGPVAAPFSSSFAITNTGNTAQRYTFDAVRSHQIGLQEWSGTVHGVNLMSYHFTVRPGLERAVGSVYWNSADRFTVKGASYTVALRVSLYDPLGRFVNYSYGVGSGYASAQVADPMPGQWTLVVSNNGRKSPDGVRHYNTQSFTARLGTYVSQPYGTLSPAAVTLAPGHAARITYSAHTPVDAGTQVVTIHAHGDHTAALPVALTSYITLKGATANFSGTFNGPSTDYFSLTNENKFYALNVVTGTRTLNVSLTWPDSGYGVVLLLLDPSGEIVDGQFNGISNGNVNGPFDLSTRNLSAIWSNPTPGRWQIVVMDGVFAGQQRAETFSGRVSVDDNLVTPAAITHTALPGSTFDVSLHVRNASGPNVAEGYIGYATADSYSNIPLGTIQGPFGNKHDLVGTDVYTYTTGFVPPGTKMVVSSVAVIHPSVTADLAFADPIGFARAEGESAPVTIDGKTYLGTTASVSGNQMPIGNWFAEVTLRRPFNAHTSATIVGSSYAYALTPQPWVTFDHGLQNGRITGGQPLILLPGQSDVLHASVTVPLDAQPGAYNAHLFVYTVFGDQVADVPLTIQVQPHSGTEPAVQAPQHSLALARR